MKEWIYVQQTDFAGTNKSPIYTYFNKNRYSCRGYEGMLFDCVEYLAGFTMLISKYLK